MINFVKQIRLDLDAHVDHISKIPFSDNVIQEPLIPERILEAREAVLMAKAWAGKMLGELGVATPYKNDGKRNSVEDIELTDAKHSCSTDWREDESYVRRIDQVRSNIKAMADEVERLSPTSRKASICRTQVWIYLVEARIKLGFELERIREVFYNTTVNEVKPKPTLHGWAQYKHKGLSEMRPYVKGEDLSAISVSKEDDPETDMGMIARNPKNHADQWYVARKFFNENFDPA